MTISTFKRYEKKFLLNGTQYQSILPDLMQYMHPDENCRNGQEYSLYNLYYDTADSSVIRQSLSKPYYKEKLRLRTYSATVSADSQVFLELKKKIGGVVSKRRAALQLDEAYQFLNSGIKPENAKYINRQVLDEIAFYLQHKPVTPSCYISYDRTAMFGKDDRDFRITFDHNIVTRRDHLSLERGSFGQELLEPGQYLMEVKISQALPLWLAELLADNHIYVTSFSKYGREYKQYRQNQSGIMSAYQLRPAV